MRRSGKARHTYTVAATLLLLASTPSSSTADAWTVRRDPEVFYRISVDAYGLGASTDDTVLMMRVGTFWAAERRLHEKRVGQPMRDQHAFIDGRSCPALEAAFMKLAELPPVRFGTPKKYDEVELILDGGEIVLSGPGEGHGAAGPDTGRLVRVADHGGPLWSWWAETTKALEPCWRPSPKLSDGVELKARLATDEDAKREKP